MFVKMLNSSETEDTVSYRMRLPDSVPMVANGSSPALTSVVVCMTIMVICAVIYFAIRCYFEERRWRAGALMCKCLPPGALGSPLSAIECGNPCRYVERRAVSVAVQTAGSEPAPSTCWTTSDVRMSEARRTGCAYSSPMANNEAVPSWRPPATGSSQRHQPHYAAVQEDRPSTIDHPKFRRQRRAYYPHHHKQNYYENEAPEREPYQRSSRHHGPYGGHPHHAVRRSRPVSVMPSINVQSPSSSDSYSVLTMSHTSKTAPLNKDLTTMTFSPSEEENHQCHHRSYQLSKSGLSEALSCFSAASSERRNNTPVSEMNNEDNDQVVINIERREDAEGDCHFSDVGRDKRRHVVGEAVDEDDLKAPASVADELFQHTSPVEMPGSATMVDGATQSCPPMVAIPVAAMDSFCAGGGVATTTGNIRDAVDVTRRRYSLVEMRRCHHATDDVNTLYRGGSVPVEYVRFRLPSKGAFPSCEILQNGRLVSRWTQTDTASMVSLDWDNYDSERLRFEEDAAIADDEADDDDVEMVIDDVEEERDDDDGIGDENHDGLATLEQDRDEATTTMSSATIILASSHRSGDSTLQASRTSQRSASSPYVLCFECSEEFSLNDERRSSSATFFIPSRRLSSSPNPRPPRRPSTAPPPVSPPSQTHPYRPTRPSRRASTTPNKVHGAGKSSSCSSGSRTLRK